MRPKCKNPDLRCTPAYKAIDNLVTLVESGSQIDLDKVKEALGECALGPTLIGTCATEQTICQHELVSETLNSSQLPDPDEQIEILTQSLV